MMEARPWLQASLKKPRVQIPITHETRSRLGGPGPPEKTGVTNPSSPQPAQDSGSPCRPRPDQECEEGVPQGRERLQWGSWRGLHQRWSVLTLPKARRVPGRASQGRQGPGGGLRVKLDENEGKGSVLLNSLTRRGLVQAGTRRAGQTF